MARKIIYIKNPSSGSNFRTVGSGPSSTNSNYPTDAFGQVINTIIGSTTGGASQSPNVLAGGAIQSPSGLGLAIGANNYNYSNFGIASMSDWQNSIQGVQTPNWADFLFDNTIFDDESNWTGELAQLLTQSAYFDPFQILSEAVNTGASSSPVLPNFLSPYNPTGYYLPIDADTIQGAFDGGL